MDIKCKEREKSLYIIFGAGQIGRMALDYYGVENIVCFIDNNEQLYTTQIRGVPVCPVESTISKGEGTEIVIASRSYRLMEQQLLELGIKNHSIFKGSFGSYYTTDKLVFNPYEDNLQRILSENEWIDTTGGEKTIESINYQVEQIYNKKLLFDHVEIETINRCNGICDFCPVSRKNEKRAFSVMDEHLFRKIIQQLADLNYNGRLALFSNNEPFLDEKIIERHHYAREKLPNARMHLFTNGTLLSLEKFKEIIPYLDELVIDNYHEKLELIKPCAEIKEYCEKHSELRKKVTIVLRDPHEVLTTRGGDAPNRSKMISYGKAKCILPFRQMIIRPNGKVSLCCNDAYGKDTMGDLTQETLLDVWQGEKFKLVRECLYKGRNYWKHCEYCDAFSTGN